MRRRNFSGLDGPTEQNLRALESHATQDGSPGDFEMIHALVVASLGIFEMLPAAIARHFDRGAFFIGDRHGRMAPARRMELWQTLAAKLAAGLDAVEADRALRAAAICDDRPQSCGERIEELCHELETALSDGTDLTAILAKLELEASGTAAHRDIREMRRLIGMKRVPDYNHWKSEFRYAIAHADRVAGELHHMPAKFPSR